MDIEREQSTYARWLAAFVRLGFTLLVASFLLYVTGILPAGTPPQRLPELWSLPLDRYLAATHAPTGWSWTRHAVQGDLLNLVGVVVLNFATLACYVRVLPLFARGGARAFVVICVAEIVVLACAAAGVFVR